MGRSRRTLDEPSPQQCRHSVLVLGLIVVVLVSASGCQQAGRRNPSARNVVLFNRRGHFDMLVRQRSLDRKPNSSGTLRETFDETILEESVTIESDGYVYHPTLLEFSVGAVLGMRQAQFDQVFGTTTESSQDTGEILEFDASGTFLQRKPYPLSFYARRGRTLEPRPFRSTLQAATTAYGLAWQYIHETTPISIQYDLNTVDLDPFLSAGEQPGGRRSETFSATISYIFNKHNEIKLSFDRESIQEKPFDFKYDLNETRLTHTLEFGKEHEHRLNSELLLLDQAGTFATKRTEWRQILFLKHRKKLSTTYELLAFERKQGSIAGGQSVNEKTVRVAAAIDHQLYDNLKSRIRVYAENQKFESGLDYTRRGLTADFRYFRHNAWGVLRLDYRFSQDNQSVSGGTQAFEVIDEAQTFRDPEPIILTDRSIELGSIRVLREDRTEQYVSGRDYRLRPIGDRVEIERIFTGRILDGQTVLLSYRFQIGGDYDFNTTAQAFSIRQEFKFGLTPYYRSLRQTQTLTPASAVGVTPDNITADILGVEYRRGKLRLDAEYERHDSTVSPFVSLRFGLDYTRRYPSGATLGLSANWSDVEFTGLGARTTRLMTIEGQYERPVSKNLNIETAVRYRQEKDTLSTDNDGIEIDLGLEWTIRRTEIKVDYRYATFNDDFADQVSSALIVQFRRRF